MASHSIRAGKSTASTPAEPTKSLTSHSIQTSHPITLGFGFGFGLRVRATGSGSGFGLRFRVTGSGYGRGACVPGHRSSTATKKKTKKNTHKKETAPQKRNANRDTKSGSNDQYGVGETTVPWCHTNPSIAVPHQDQTTGMVSVRSPHHGAISIFRLSPPRSPPCVYSLIYSTEP